MIREVDLVSYLPPYLQEYKEQKNVLTAENPEFTIIWDATDKVLYNEFIATADEYGIARFENILGILPFLEDTLESRRTRVQSRWFTSIPYTMKLLVEKLVAVCGTGNFTITKKLNLYHIQLDTELVQFGQVEEIEQIVQTIIPCNIVVLSQNHIICEPSGALYVAGTICVTELIIITE